MWCDDAVLPFGYGPHYTWFAASFAESTPTPYSYGGGAANLTKGGSYDAQNLISSCTAAHPDLCAFPAASISVANMGSTTSGFVALVLTCLNSTASGAAQCVSLNVTLGALARGEQSGDSVLYPGKYSFLLDVPTQATLPFKLTGSGVTMESWPQPPSNQTHAAVESCPVEGACWEEPV